MKIIVVVFVLNVINFVLGLPVPVSRRYGYEHVDNGYHAPAGLGGYGQRYGVGGRGLADHATWCPLRAREALRPLQRLPPTSGNQGPGYFNYAQNDDDTIPRYGRSYQTGDHVQQINDFSNVDNMDTDDGGVDVGGVLWPRRITPKPPPTMDEYNVENPKHDNGCSHHKAASFAKDATAAASTAADAAAAAARAAAKATAAAACNPEGIPDDTQDDTESDENSDVPLGYRVVYPKSNGHQDEDYHSQGFMGSDMNIHSNTDSETDQDITSGANSQYTTEIYFEDTARDSKVNSETFGGRGLYSKDTTSNGVNSYAINGVNSDTINGVKSDTINGVKSEGSVRGKYSQDNTKSGVNSQTGTGVYSQVPSKSVLRSQGNDSKQLSQVATRNGVNSQSTSTSQQYSQGSTNKGVNSQGGSGMNSLGALSKGANSNSSANRGVNSQGSGSVVNSKGSGSEVNSHDVTSSWLNSKEGEASGHNIPDKIKKNFTLVNSKRQENLTEDHKDDS